MSTASPTGGHAAARAADATAADATAAGGPAAAARPEPVVSAPPADGAGSNGGTGDGEGARGRFSFVEAVMDSLPTWALLAAAIGLLYLVWVTIEVMTHYVGPVPKVTP